MKVSRMMFRCAASPIVAMTLVVLACGETSGQQLISWQTPPDNSLSFESWDSPFCPPSEIEMIVRGQDPGGQGPQDRTTVAIALLASGLCGQQPDAALTDAESQLGEPAVTSQEPQPELERPTVWGEPTEVRVLIFMIDVDDVDSAQQSFAASVYYEARWNSPYLKHPGPGPLHRRTTEVWTPRLVIVNQQMAWPSFPGAVEIQPDGEVIMRQKVWGRFSQQLELRDFPMDTQTLSIQLAAAGLLEQEVKLVPLEEGSDRSGIADSLSIPDFEVLSWEAKTSPYVPTAGDGGIAGFEMRIDMRRRIPYFVTKVIVPLCLIVIMSWVPRWIDPEQVGTNIGISTTSFLTLVAYLFAINVLLPPVSYITRLDRFILLSTLMVFASLMQTVATASLTRRKKLELVERVDRWSRMIYPLILLGVLALSFLL